MKDVKKETDFVQKHTWASKIDRIISSITDFLVSLYDFFTLFFSRLSLQHFILRILALASPTIEESNQLFSDEDVDFFGENRGGNKFLGKYREKDVEAVIKKSGLFARLDQEFPDWYVQFDLSDCFSHYGYIRSRSIPEKDKYIAFIIVHVGIFSLEKPFLQNRGAECIRTYLPKKVDFLNIKWFSLQNPKQKFTPERPRLPGQMYPGTGMGCAALKLLTAISMNAGRDGIVNNPEHFHNAYLYEGFLFLNPTDQGIFQKMIKDLTPDIKEYKLSVVSWAIYLGFLTENGEKFTWNLHEQVLPLSMRMVKYFHRRAYRREVKRSKDEHGPFKINWKEAKQSALSPIIDDQSLTPSHNW